MPRHKNVPPVNIPSPTPSLRRRAGNVMKASREPQHVKDAVLDLMLVGSNSSMHGLKARPRHPQAVATSLNRPYMTSETVHSSADSVFTQVPAEEGEVPQHRFLRNAPHAPPAPQPGTPAAPSAPATPTPTASGVPMGVGGVGGAHHAQGTPPKDSDTWAHNLPDNLDSFSAVSGAGPPQPSDRVVYGEDLSARSVVNEALHRMQRHTAGGTQGAAPVGAAVGTPGDKPPSPPMRPLGEPSPGNKKVGPAPAPFLPRASPRVSTTPKVPSPPPQQALLEAQKAAQGSSMRAWAPVAGAAAGAALAGGTRVTPRASRTPPPAPRSQSQKPSFFASRVREMRERSCAGSVCSRAGSTRSSVAEVDDPPRPPAGVALTQQEWIQETNSVASWGKGARTPNAAPVPRTGGTASDAVDGDTVVAPGAHVGPRGAAVADAAPKTAAGEMSLKLHYMNLLDRLVEAGEISKNHCTLDMDAAVLQTQVAWHTAKADRKVRVNMMRTDMQLVLQVPELVDAVLFAGALNLSGTTQRIMEALEKPEYESMLYRLNIRYMGQGPQKPIWVLGRLVLSSLLASLKDGFTKGMNAGDMMSWAYTAARRMGLLKLLGMDEDGDAAARPRQRPKPTLNVAQSGAARGKGHGIPVAPSAKKSKRKCFSQS